VSFQVWFRGKALELADSLKAAALRVITEQIGPFDSSCSIKHKFRQQALYLLIAKSKFRPNRPPWGTSEHREHNSGGFKFL
jgi:hypothetical protein